MKAFAVILLTVCSVSALWGQRFIPGIPQQPKIDTIPATKPTSAFKIGRVKYSGGGDWYNDPQEEPNLLKYVHEHTNIAVDAEYHWVDLNSDNLFTYPFLFLTGHGNISFTENEVERLRSYLENGGFLLADDDYGMDKYIRREMKKVFPDQEFTELPFSHGIYHCFYDFPNGLPKIMEHDGKPPQGFGLFYKGRLCVYYTYETNPSDGWDDPETHEVPEDKRQEAFRFGTNIVVWALTH
jgi:hypothetical protein